MPEHIDKEAIQRELNALRSELRNFTSMGAFNPLVGAKHSDWSAHANWSSSSSKLNGNFSMESKLGNPAKFELLEDAMKDVSSIKFIEVAKEMSQVIREG